jgi:hypothetical protein
MSREMDQPNRPWWLKKRWWAAGAVVAVAAYMASLGPAAYCEARGWLSATAADRIRVPADLYVAYVEWWRQRGWSHVEALPQPATPGGGFDSVESKPL